MRPIYYLIAASVVGGGLWLVSSDTHSSSSSNDSPNSSAPKPDLTLKSSDPNSPQVVGDAVKPVSIDGPAPKLFKSPRPAQRPADEVSSPRPITPEGPQVKGSSGELNPDAVEYYSRVGFFGAPKEAIAVMQTAHPGQWEPVAGSGGLGFQQMGGEVSLTFEENESGAIHGAVVEIKGGGGGPRLMTVEMWMTGMEKPWDMQWEVEHSGPIAGQIKTHKEREVHYYCDMKAMDPSGAISEPARCHFMLGAPTPEELAYRKLSNAPPLRRAYGRFENMGQP